MVWSRVGLANNSIGRYVSFRFRGGGGVSSYFRKRSYAFSTLEPEEEEQEIAELSSLPPEERQPWKTLLEFPARASWRIADEPSDALEAALDHVMAAPYGGVRRKKKYLRSIFQNDIIKVQHELVKRRERERVLAMQRSFKKKKADEKEKEKKVVRPVVYGRDQVLAAYFFRLVSNYAVAKRVLEETRSLLGGPSLWKPQRILDMGMGCGSASAACLEVLNENCSIEWIHGVDSSQVMQQASHLFLQEFVRQLQEEQDIKSSPRFTFSTNLAASADAGFGFDLALLVYTISDFPCNESTLAAAALMWEKLAPNGIFVMIEPGTPDGFASCRMVRNLLLAANDARECDDNDEKRSRDTGFCRILAPCTHNGPCPVESFYQKLRSSSDRDVTPKAKNKQGDEDEGGRASDDDVDENDDDENDDDEKDDDEKDDDKNDDDKIDDDKNDDENDNDDDDTERLTKRGFCSFVQSMPPRSGRNRSEKFSYLVAQKRTDDTIRGSDVASFAEDRLVELLTQTLQEEDRGKRSVLVKKALDLEERYVDSTEDDLGLELVRGDENRSAHGRIIHAPIKRRGHVFVECCTAPGSITRQKISKSKSKIMPGIFTAARKSRWGGLWPNIKDLEG